MAHQPPPANTRSGAVAQLGERRPLQGGGRGFEPPRLHQHPALHPSRERPHRTDDTSSALLRPGNRWAAWSGAERRLSVAAASSDATSPSQRKSESTQRILRRQILKVSLHLMR